MRLNMRLAAVLTAATTLSTTVLAERMLVREYCLTLICKRPATWVTGSGQYDIDASDGCRIPGVPNLQEFCVDVRNQRAHFRYGGQGKRCLVVTSSEWQTCSDDYQWATCATEVWEEVPCT